MRRLTVIAVLAMAGAGTVACRSEAGSAVRLLHDSLRPGMTIEQVLEEVHEVYAAHPKAWMFCAVWGTPVPVGHDHVSGHAS